VKPIAILLLGGASLAATLTVTSWISAGETHSPSAGDAPAPVQEVRKEESTLPSTNYSRSHRHSHKWDKAKASSVVRSEQERK
jgi:hypothetical protein